MPSQYWFNGKFNVSWQMEKELKKLNIDLKDYDKTDDLVAHLYNLQLDHTSHGKLDYVGLDIANCIREIERINK